MSADTLGRRLKVLAAGLHELGARCETRIGELSTAAAPSLVDASSWQANAGAVNIAYAGSRRDLTALTGRMKASGTKYAEAGTSYTQTEEESAASLRGLVV